FRCFVSQRLRPLKTGGRIAVVEVLKSTMRTREYLARGEEGAQGKSLLDAMRDGALDGMQHFDGEIEALVRKGLVSLSTALLNASNPRNLRLCLADMREVDDEETPAV